LAKEQYQIAGEGHGDLMTRRAGLTFGLMLVALCWVAISVGSVLLVMAQKMPPHTDERRADELTRLYEYNYTKGPEQLEPIKQQIVALRTSKWELYDAGLNLCLFSATLLFAVLLFGIWDLRNLWAIRTPRTRSRLLGLASVALLVLLLPAFQLQIDYEYTRDDLAPTVDTGHGAELFVGTALFLLLWIPMVVVGRFLVLRRVSLPANLWCWNRDQPRRSLIISTLFGFLALTLGILIVWSASNFSWAIPSLMVGLYVILSSRAAVMNVVGQT
jgi:hypothetical protein